MKKTAIQLMLIMLISKAIGFFREITLSYFYGASNITDIYVIAETIPITIFGFISNGISTGYIPMYSRIEVDHGTEDANKYTSNLVNVTIVMCTILIVIGFIFTEPLVKIFATGFDKDAISLAVKFARITLFGMYSIGLVAIYSGFLQIKGNQIIPASIGLPMNLIIITSIVLSSKTNVVFLAIGSLLGAISQFVFMMPYTRKVGYKHKSIVNFKDEYIKKMAYIALPIILGASVNQVSTLIDRTLASSIAVGGITSLNYASKMTDIVIGLFASTIVAIIYPTMSKMAANNDFGGLKKSLGEAVNTINILIIPSTIGMMVFSEQVIRLLFERGAFKADAIEMTSGALFYYSLGIVGFGIRQILYRVFYSLQNTKTPVINAIVSVLIDIVLNVVLSRYMGINGLALSSSISALICTGLLFISLRRKIGPYGLKDIIITSTKILFASLVMGLVASLSYNSLVQYINSNLALILVVGLAVIVYGIIIYFMKIEEVDIMVLKAKEKVNAWRKKS